MSVMNVDKVGYGLPNPSPPGCSDDGDLDLKAYVK